ncbi:MAG: meso-butanediol dehydrogenase/(S,S)-butanediol dehydrogenase/diacetyl reductase, partial [Porticoccaceae bacterium]
MRRFKLIGTLFLDSTGIDMDKTRLSGKHVLITGAAQGMGAAVGEYYAAQGAKVCLADINLAGCEEVATRIKSAGGSAIAVMLDVTKRDQMKAAVAATVEAFGSINVILNNAGINKPMMFLDITEENWHSIMDINA